jgi:MFS family permease
LERTLYSAFLFCLLRGIADFALTGEYLSSNIYIAESYSKSQTAYYSGLLDLVCNLGVVASLVISFISLRFLPQKIYEVPSWTFPFFIGSIVALVGYQTRKKVKESLDYTILKYSSEEKIVSIKEIYLYYKHNILRIVGIELLFGFGFVFVYVFCVKLLVEAKMSPSEILLNNAIVALIQGLSSYMWGWLAYDYDPIKITKMRSYLLLIWILSLGICFSSFITSPVEIFVCQCFSVILGVDHIPSIGVLLKGLPIQARSRTFNKAFFIGKTVMYILTSFVIYKLSDMFGFNIIFYAWLIIGVIFSYCIHTYIQYENIPFENKMRFLH